MKWLTAMSTEKWLAMKKNYAKIRIAHFATDEPS